MDLPVDLTVLSDDGLYLWAPRGAAGAWGLANCLLIGSRDEAALVDTPYDARMTRALIAAAARVLPEGTQVRTVVNTHANGDHCYGNSFFPGAEIISTRASLERHCHEITPQQMQYLVHASDPADPLGWYARERFGAYDYSDVTVVPPTATFSGSYDLRVGDVDVRLVEVGPAHTAGDLVVHLPGQGVVAAGDVVFPDDHPVHWEGPLAEVVRACETVLALDADRIVPGHGAVIGPDGLRAHIAYLRELEGLIHERHARGQGAYEAADSILAGGFHPHLGAPERVVMLTFIEYHHLAATGAPPDMAALASHAARWAYDQRHVSTPA
ncbi:MBL fold metallo-hydrolase [Streptomyces sp. NPDC059063]|uniref:MBL fold metallo-hydrolase n=1 Tax=unclassified Streptomyces TaxID=2593676 RepID=UPI00369DED9A